MREPEPTLEQVIEDFVGGDDAAGDVLCASVAPTIRSVVFRVLSSTDPDAEDIVQDSLIAMLGYLRRASRPPRNLEAFTRTIARNRCVNLLVWRRRRRAADVDKFAESIPDIAASPLEVMEARSSRELLDAILDRMDEACRSLLESIYRAERPIEELREQLGLKSVQAVYYRKEVCIRKAQKVLNRLLLSSLGDERGPTPTGELERRDG